MANILHRGSVFHRPFSIRAAVATKLTQAKAHARQLSERLHAEGVRELSPGWSEAEPWVFELICTPL